MQIRLRMLILSAAPMLLSACATKGWVHKQIAIERAYTDTAIMNATTNMNSQLAAERSARIAGDSMLATRLEAQTAQLRTDLDALRSQFNAKIAMVENGLMFAMPVTFGYDEATVADADRPMVERFAQVAQKYYPGSVITVEGFADPAGGDQYNVDLSRRRAENVKTMLGSLGLGEVRAVGYGKKRQVVPGASRDEPGAQENRRVVFVIESRGNRAAVAAAQPNE